MEPQEHTFPEPETPKQRRQFANSMTVTILIFEGLIGLAGLAGGAWVGVSWGYFLIPRPLYMLYGIAAGTFMFLVHLILIFPGGAKNPLYRWIYKPFADALLKPLGMLGFEDIILISIVSGFAEEMMFRGFIQTRFGIVAASLFFGLIHIWGKKALPYAIYAIAMGFYLGGFFYYANNLWIPMLAHTVNNLLGLLMIKLNYAPDIKIK
ncbi:MAG: CPBP family intramembrane glutamic endopeptidase [bacterium]